MNSLKMAFSFISGILVCGLILFGVKNVLPIRADTDNLSGQSENTTQSFLNLLPDIEKIYHESLTMPFKKAESKIYDPDIANFYHELMGKSVLSDPGDQTPSP
jgi:hypothetical protein